MIRFRLQLLGALLLVLLQCSALVRGQKGASASGADAPTPQTFDRKEFAARRAKLFEQIGDGIAVVLAAEQNEQAIRFRQAPDFYYLTGLEEPGAILLMLGSTKQSIIFAQKRSPVQVRFEGPGIRDVPNAAEAYGLTAVQPAEGFLTALKSASKEARKIYLPLSPPDSAVKSRGEMEASDAAIMKHPLYSYVPLYKQAAGRIRELLPDLEVLDLNAHLNNLRWVKTPYEIERMRRSGKIGAAAVVEAIKGTRPGMFEYEVEAAARFVFHRMGAQTGFPPIVASGPNTITWHYLANNRRMLKGEIVLMDAGADYEYYFSDITRTWPVSGRFTPEQERMYSCVLEASRAIIAGIRPGVRLKQLQDIAQKVYKKHGFEQEFLKLNRYIGHTVGLSAHDVNPTEAARPLQAGVIFNVEPILEVLDKRVHFRLEDTVLVTPEGAENLTADAPTELEAIYTLIRQKRPGAN